ncbi:FkbM family methyltransferase [Bacillus manliponensis]|uniref:FkbM family methyltransferase n=1 Tax=Bacillus manliponensis TaxID=574376 RepID=UPI00068ACB26|nr:FkbM family methyltransferase [Bacillus manliponensis]
MNNTFSLNVLETMIQDSNTFIQREIYEQINNNKSIILFGAGTWGTSYLEAIKNSFNTILFCDNDPSKWKDTVEGIPVIGFDELKKSYNNYYIAITTLQYYDEVLQQLEKNHLTDKLVHLDVLLTRNNYDSFVKAYDLLADEHSKQIFYERICYCITANPKYLIPLRSKGPQYFEQNILSLSNKEVFIDGGAYTGDTVEEFLKQTKGNFKKIYSFEPEESKHKEFLKKFSPLKNIKLIPYGLWKKNDVLRFNSKDDASSSVNKNGNIEIPVVSIDEYLDGKPATFIKMDIEGAELMALKGAKKTIKKYKPKLAICVYHKPLDLVQIPLFLKELVPDYRIYLRHYNINHCETVCYAIID